MVDVPKVFVSHASEDKPFVLELATRLRSDGVDAWIDKWEISIGDKLVEKIFTEGIGSCQAFLVVLSATSVQKKWVREELNSGVVEAIERQVKLLPIRIDDCEVPVALRSRKWLNMNPTNYEGEYRELVDAIFGKRDKPRLGIMPSAIADQVEGFSANESALLRFLVDVASKHGPFAEANREQCASVLQNLNANELRNVVEMLAHEGVALVRWYLGPNFHVKLSPTGWVEHAAAILGFDANEDLNRVLATIVADGPCNGDSLSKSTGLDQTHLIMAVNYLEGAGYLKVSRALGGPLTALFRIDCTPQGRRASRL